eukprot:gene2029-3952_t
MRMSATHLATRSLSAFLVLLLACACRGSQHEQPDGASDDAVLLAREVDSVVGLGVEPAELITRARALANAGDGDGADGLLQLAASLAPESGEALMLRGNLAAYVFKPARLVEAEAHYLAALEAEPTRWETHYFLGRLLVDTRQFERASAVLGRAAELNATNAAVHELHAAAHAGAGSFDGAAAAYLASAALDRHVPSPYHSLARAALRLGRPADAVAALRQLVDRFPWHAGHMLELAALH